MLRHLTAGCLAAFLVVCLAERTSAKPPDLPENEPIIVGGPADQPAPCPEPAQERGVATCPQRCPPADRRVLTQADGAALPSVMDNLRALEQAALEIEQAKQLGHAGKIAEAREHLDRARRLCPGSSYTRRADEVAAEMTAATTAPSCPEGQYRPPTRNPKAVATEAGRAVGDCLHRPINLTFESTPLNAALDQLRTLGVPVTCDAAALEMNGLTGHVPITVHVERMPVMTALDVIGRPLGLQPRICGKGVCLTSPTAPCCGPGAEVGNAPACPKCEQMHARAVKKRKKAAGVEEQVNGLMKACYLAISAGRHGRAADLARQAHALDPKRVEADPVVYKLHLLAETGKSEECEPGPGVEAVCPAAPSDGAPAPEASTGSLMIGLGVNRDGGLTGSIVIHERNFNLFRGAGQEVAAVADREVSLRPELPRTDPGVVQALDAVLTEKATKEVPVAAAETCPCCEIARGVGTFLLDNLFGLPTRDESENGSLTLGMSLSGDLTLCSLSKVAGMKVLVQYRDGIPLIWVQPDAEK